MIEAEGTEGATNAAAPGVPDTAPAEYENLLASGRELETSRDLQHDRVAESVKDLELPGMGLLAALLSAAVFCELFHRLALKRYNLDTPEARIAQMARRHPFYYRTCRWLDLVTRAFLVLIMVSAVALIAWGIIRRTFFYDGFWVPASQGPQGGPR